MTGIIKNHNQEPVRKNKASAANGVSAMIVSRLLSRNPRVPLAATVPVGSCAGPAWGRSAKSAPRSARVAAVLARVARSSCSPGSSRPARQCSPSSAIALSRSALPTRAVFPIPSSDPATSRFSLLTKSILPVNSLTRVLWRVSYAMASTAGLADLDTLAHQAVGDAVGQTDPAGLHDVGRDPNGVPRGHPIGVLHQNAGGGIGAVSSIEQADPEVDQLDLGQLGVGARQRLANRPVQRVHRAVTLGRDDDPLAGRPQLDCCLRNRVTLGVRVVRDDSPGLHPEVAGPASQLLTQQQVERRVGRLKGPALGLKILA